MKACEIVDRFNDCFACAANTTMIGGAQEPLYLPAATGRRARLLFREDFAASALHEAAHWCIAGRRRLEQRDFGYTYVAPPRNAQQQAAFFLAELKAQSLESIFADAAGVAFWPSADNLDACTERFSARIRASRPALETWLRTSSDARARTFLASLRKSHGAG